VFHFFGVTAALAPHLPYFIWALMALNGLSIPLCVSEPFSTPLDAN
jgi:hypothetical protein